MASARFLVKRAIASAKEILTPQQRAILVIRTADTLDYETVMNNSPANDYDRAMYMGEILRYAQLNLEWPLLNCIDEFETVSWESKVCLVRFWIISVWRAGVTWCDGTEVRGELVSIQATYQDFLDWCQARGARGEVVSELDFDEIFHECVEIYHTSIMV